MKEGQLVKFFVMRRKEDGSTLEQEWHTGEFLRWGTDWEEVNEKGCEFTVAIVQGENGKIYNVYPPHVQKYNEGLH